LANSLASSLVEFDSKLRRTSMGTILIILLVLLLLGALPTWPYSGGWGYYPSGGLGLVLLIVVILALTGRV
jgi:Protein of unknown function (DUF3309)